MWKGLTCPVLSERKAGHMPQNVAWPVAGVSVRQPKAVEGRRGSVYVGALGRSHRHNFHGDSNSISMTEAEQALAAIIARRQPRTLVALGDCARALAGQWCEHHSCQLSHLAASDAASGLELTEVQDLALISDCLEELSHGEGETLLGQLRNYGTRQIAVLVAEDAGWTLQDFIALGFRRQARFESEARAHSLYTYNIDNYNHQRPWNNPRFWANPEMWGKAWW